MIEGLNAKVVLASSDDGSQEASAEIGLPDQSKMRAANRFCQTIPPLVRLRLVISGLRGTPSTIGPTPEYARGGADSGLARAGRLPRLLAPYGKTFPTGKSPVAKKRRSRASPQTLRPEARQAKRLSVTVRRKSQLLIQAPASPITISAAGQGGRVNRRNGVTKGRKDHTWNTSRSVGPMAPSRKTRGGRLVTRKGGPSEAATAMLSALKSPQSGRRVDQKGGQTPSSGRSRIRMSRGYAKSQRLKRMKESIVGLIEPNNAWPSRRRSSPKAIPRPLKAAAKFSSCYLRGVAFCEPNDWICPTEVAPMQLARIAQLEVAFQKGLPSTDLAEAGVVAGDDALERVVVIAGLAIVARRLKNAERRRGEEVEGRGRKGQRRNGDFSCPLGPIAARGDHRDEGRSLLRGAKEPFGGRLTPLRDRMAVAKAEISGFFSARCGPPVFRHCVTTSCWFYGRLLRALLG